MKKLALIAAVLAASASLAYAVDTTNSPQGDIAKKEMQDHPGTKGGSTDMPTAKPDSSAPGDKQATELPKAGTTADPTATPTASDLSDKEMKDHPGVKQ